jgi:hypothetical protein
MIIPSSTWAYILPICGIETTSSDETTNSLTELEFSLKTDQFAWDGTAETNKNDREASNTLTLNILTLRSCYIKYKP